MNPYTKIESEIQIQAAAIADELIEIRMYEIDRLKSQLKIRLKEAIVSALKSFESAEEKELNLLLNRQAHIGTGNQVLNRQISRVNEKIKEARRALHTIRDWDEYLSLKKFIRTKCGDGILEEFYKDIPMIVSERKRKHEIKNQ